MIYAASSTRTELSTCSTRCASMRSPDQGPCSDVPMSPHPDRSGRRRLRHGATGSSARSRKFTVTRRHGARRSAGRISSPRAFGIAQGPIGATLSSRHHPARHRSSASTQGSGTARSAALFDHWCFVAQTKRGVLVSSSDQTEPLDQNFDGRPRACVLLDMDFLLTRCPPNGWTDGHRAKP